MGDEIDVDTDSFPIVVSAVHIVEFGEWWWFFPQSPETPSDTAQTVFPWKDEPSEAA